MKASNLIGSRRDFVGGVAATALLAGGRVGAEESPSPEALSEPDNLLTVYRTMRGGVDEGAALWWLTGTLFAKVLGETNVPLVQVHGASWNRITTRDDGNLDQAMDEAGYFADVDSGEILKTWTNPINGHKATPDPYKTVSREIITPTAVQRHSNNPITVKGKVGPVILNGDVIWVSEIFSATVPSSMTGGPPRIVESMATFQAQVADVDPASQQFVPCNLFFQEIDPFYGWMGMPADTAGLLVWQVVGRKLRSRDEVPGFLAQRLEADYKGFLTNPQV